MTPVPSLAGLRSVRKRAVDERNLYHILLSSLDSLLDRVRDFLGLARSETDVARLVSDDDECRERHVLTALDDLRHPVYRDELVFEDKSVS